MNESRIASRRHRRFPFFFLVGLVIHSALSASTAHAQDGLTGSWMLQASSAETSQRRAAIETSTRDLPSFAQSRARERLEERTSPPPKVRIAVTGDQVELSGRGQNLRLTIGGPAVRVEAEGQRGSARATRRDGNLVITMEGGRGARTTTYRLSTDGQRLVLDVEFTAQILSEPVRYRSTYERS